MLILLSVITIFFFSQSNSRSSTLFWANYFQLGPLRQICGGWGLEEGGAWLFPGFDRQCRLSYLPWLHFKPVRCCLHKTHPGVASNIQHLRAYGPDGSGAESFLPGIFMKGQFVNESTGTEREHKVIKVSKARWREIISAARSSGQNNSFEMWMDQTHFPHPAWIKDQNAPELNFYGVCVFFCLPPQQMAAKCAVTFSGVVSVADSQSYHF